MERRGGHYEYLDLDPTYSREAAIEVTDGVLARALSVCLEDESPDKMRWFLNLCAMEGIRT